MALLICLMIVLFKSSYAQCPTPACKFVLGTPGNIGDCIIKKDSLEQAWTSIINDCASDATSTIYLKTGYTETIAKVLNEVNIKSDFIDPATKLAKASIT
jgi:hypothetical protein